ncbi:MAG: YraN family protein [Alistipes sp.]|uniref:YraN family protein n=1 Tax=Alistipes sp. TaxID=1872444 RepID=UPI001B71C6F4|nr:YraN family protein [Alistipes sp.]
MPTTIEIGSRGEDAAVEWLRERGFYIVERNWRVGHYEIDIIAQHFDTLHIIEVKTRKLGGWQSPYDSINDQKRRTLRRGALAYRTLHRIRLDLQFDLIAVTIDDHGHLAIEYTENIL